MTKRVKRALLLIWRMIYPLLLYQTLVELVLLGYQQMGGVLSDRTVLPLTAAGAFLAAIPLGHLYYQLRETDRLGEASDRQETAEATETAEMAGVTGAGDRRSVSAMSAMILWSAAAGISASLCFNNLLAMLPLPSDSAKMAMALLNRPAFFMQILCTVLILPLTEELVFRGLGYWRIRRELPFWGAAVLSAVYFGLYHGNIYQGIYACFLGFLLAVLLERTDSFFAVWAFHAAANLISVTANAMAWDRGIFEYVAVRLVIITGSGLLLAFSFYKLREDGRKREVTIHSDSLL